MVAFLTAVELIIQQQTYLLPLNRLTTLPIYFLVQVWTMECGGMAAGGGQYHQLALMGFSEQVVMGRAVMALVLALVGQEVTLLAVKALAV
jgi:hypothetical protein